MDVSVIIVNYNTRELTKQCIESIYEKTIGLNFDIWVIDNASSDSSVEFISREFPQVNIVRNTNNVGFGAACNIGINKSKGKYIFLLNSDTILINNAIKILFNLLESSPDFAAAGGGLYNQKGEFAYSCGDLPNLTKYILCKIGLKKLCKSKKLDMTKTQRVEQVSGADCMARRTVLEEVGGFNPVFFMYNEELELEYRINKAGYNIMFTPEAKIIHLEKKSYQDNNLRQEHIKRSEYLYFSLTCAKSNKLFIKSIFTLLYLIKYNFKLPLQEALKTIKNYWKS